MTKRLLSITVAISFMLTACGGSGSAPSSKVRVVATTTIIGDMARNIAGDTADVITLLTPGIDPHEYEPVPTDLQALSQAKIVFANGGGLEPWLPKIMQSTGSSIKIQTLTDGLTLRTLNEGGATVTDPHVWFDANNAIHFAEQIRDSLITNDPPNAEAYRTNAENYIARLTDLDSSIKKQVEAIPPKQRLLVTNHDTFGYFAAQYGFKVIGTVFPTGGAEASPSAQQVVELVNKIKASQVKAIFTENTLNPELANTIAQEAGVKVITQLYTDSLGPQNSPASTYIDMMQFDVKTIVEALK